MYSEENAWNELRQSFAFVMTDALRREIPEGPREEIATYLAGLLSRFMRTDAIFAIRDAEGQEVTTLGEMIAEGDIQQRADSFERERVVHRHIGDFLLFWSGVYPGYLRQLRLKHEDEWLRDFTQQGRESYHFVSTFDYPPHDGEAPLYRRLSNDFEVITFCLGQASRKLNLS